MRQLTEIQNDRLRQAMEAWMKEQNKNSTELALFIRRKQPSLSPILSRQGGASYETARRFASAIGRDVFDVIGPAEPGELHPARSRAIPPSVLAQPFDSLVNWYLENADLVRVFKRGKFSAEEFLAVRAESAYAGGPGGKLTRSAEEIEAFIRNRRKSTSTVTIDESALDREMDRRTKRSKPGR